MTQQEQQKAAKKFAEDWKDKGYEKGESQKFWLDLLCNVYGIKDFANFVYFENQIKEKFSDKTITNFIDIYIPSTKVMIEQKSIDKDLRSPIKQSDGTLLNPFQQARKYISGLPLSLHPRWVITCNFKSFLVYDMEQPNGEPEEILLENLEKEYYRLSFITDTGSEHIKKELEISKKAGDIIGEIYDAILAQYKDAHNPSAATLRSLNMLCVRIVFCLYAEDAGVFGHKSIFGDYLKTFEAKDLRRALLDLFQVLDQKPEERDEYLEETLASFPYVNGGLFTEEDKTIPPLTEDIKELLVRHASSEFDWSEISPTIFGAIFESTLNQETRRSGGMHYTSIENIHKVIDPLFLDDLKAEFETLKDIKSKNIREQKIIEFQKKLGSLKFLDPACGSGNFLTESYLSLRKLENECLKLRFDEAVLDLIDDAVFVHIHQFYGIEINDFAAVVAKTALWIAESQMMTETSKILQRNLDFLPLKTYANIVEGNALRIDWESVVPKTELNYILGNPPFVGARWMSKEQKTDVLDIFGSKWDGVGDLDYVCCWYKKATDYIQHTEIKSALVSTNSITQGGAVTNLWKPLFEKFGIHIDFAWRTFRWDSEANIKAHVHCVIVGFSQNLTPSATQPPLSISEETERGLIRIKSPVNPKKLELARKFRKEPTQMEERVWEMLRNRKIMELKWRRQYVIEGFIADFYCAELKLALEIDGEIHDNEKVKEYDEIRRQVFNEVGIKTIRVKNSNCNIANITKLIENEINQTKPLATPSGVERGADEGRRGEVLKKIYINESQFIEAENINGYLLNAQNIFIEKRMKPLSDVPEICLGGQAIDDGNLVLTLEEKAELLKKEPNAEKFFRPYMMGKDFIDRKPRACLWLVGANPSELKQCPQILKRIENVKIFREKSDRTSTLKAAATPTLFAAPFECKNDYIAIPKVSSEQRRYIPMDYLSKEIIPGDKLFTMQGASLFHFGVMTSNVHNAWMRAVCGRLKSDYSYSNTIVYNNFPWCSPTDEQKTKIEQTAQAILDARAKYPNCSLADLYDETVMPPELRKAHQENDKAVMQAYGFNLKMTESECVAELFKMYEEMVKK